MTTNHYEAWLTTHAHHTNWCDVSVFAVTSDGIPRGEPLFTAQTRVPTGDGPRTGRGQETRAGRAIRAQNEAVALLINDGWKTAGPWTITHLGYRVNCYLIDHGTLVGADDGQPLRPADRREWEACQKAKLRQAGNARGVYRHPTLKISVYVDGGPTATE